MKKFLLSGLLCVLVILTHAQTGKQVADSNNMFAFEFYKHVDAGKNNVFYSPFSITTAMAMAQTGARNETYRQIGHVMHFNTLPKRFMGGIETLVNAVESDTLTDTANHVVINLANSIWLGDSLKVKQTYADLMTNIYHATSTKVSFADTNTRNIINNWVEGKTNGKIKNLIQQGILNPSTRMVLVNAIYFNARWQTPFPKEFTLQKSFYISKHDSVMADMMHITNSYLYYEDENLQAVQMPYKGNSLSMIVLLPKGVKAGFDKMESLLDEKYYNKILDSMSTKKVKLSLPKFKTTDEFQLKDVLSKMGMPIPFTPNADFSSLTDESLCIDKVIHKAFIDVTESGTEAAAATAIIIHPSMIVSPKSLIMFNANHPFVFVIRDNDTGCILFMGKIMNPLQ
ncbi:MAG TPA: serpin family protein [Bacteroidia bacterium]|nr:serpin family protein [Bacteroidia bacterium]